mmetsp:Transcript_497/g.1599  ORF Transcript_497/g.1599 Transcript_497/m.1599 type:complete len:162 (-) Transcript_497:1879-2364(-)
MSAAMTTRVASARALSSRAKIAPPRATRVRTVLSRSSRDRSAVVVRAAWVLKNVGPKTKDHLDEDDEVVTPGDLPLTSPRMVVGRAASESVSLEIAVPTVSGAHAMLEVSEDAVRVVDLSSTNGTFIDGEELQAGVAYALDENGEVVFGDEFLACYQLVKA